MNFANDKIPAHLGLILDGNRRWAKARNLPTLEGHRAGYAALKTITEAALNRGVKFVTAFVFSTENWSRTAEEVRYLMSLAAKMLTVDLNEVNGKNIRVLWSGSEEKVNPKLVRSLREAEAATAGNTRGVLNICFNYGGRDEIVRACRLAASQAVDPNEITEQAIEQHLYNPEVPALDLLIRTSGEKRISNFMLWRAAYAELYFTDRLWPDFTEKDLDAALSDYAARKRRFGG